MFAICEYNFCLDKNAMDKTITDVPNVKNTKIQNGVFDHINLTRNVKNEYSSQVPELWDFFTIMNCNFNGTINAGNVDFTLDMVDKIKVKRRKSGTFNWIILAEIDINKTEDLSFNLVDNLNENDVEYEYAFVPVLNGIDGNYLINTVHSKFDGVFICDYDTIFKFYTGVSYGNLESVQKIGIKEPVGAKYPIITTNSKTNYSKGSVSGDVINTDYNETGMVDRKAIVSYQKLLDNFLKNKRAKILKDWNGNSWLIIISGSPNISYNNNYGMGLAKFSAEWTEQGSVNNQDDLYENGLIKAVE